MESHHIMLTVCVWHIAALQETLSKSRLIQ